MGSSKNWYHSCLIIWRVWDWGALLIPWAIVAYWVMLDWVWLRNASIFAGLFGMVSSLSGGGGVGCFIGVFGIVMILGLSIIVIPLRFLWSLICLVLSLINWLLGLLIGTTKGMFKGLANVCSWTVDKVSDIGSKGDNSEKPVSTYTSPTYTPPLPPVKPTRPVFDIPKHRDEVPEKEKEPEIKKEKEKKQKKKEEKKETEEKKNYGVALYLKGDKGNYEIWPSARVSFVGKMQLSPCVTEVEKVELIQFSIVSDQSGKGKLWMLKPLGKKNRILINGTEVSDLAFLSAGQVLQIATKRSKTPFLELHVSFKRIHKK